MLFLGFLNLKSKSRKRIEERKKDKDRNVNTCEEASIIKSENTGEFFTNIDRDSSNFKDFRRTWNI